MNWDAVKLVQPPRDWTGPLLDRFVELYYDGESQLAISEILSGEFKFAISCSSIAGRIRRMKLEGKLQSRPNPPPIRRDAKVRVPSERPMRNLSTRVRRKPTSTKALEPRKSKRMLPGATRTLAQNQEIARRARENFGKISLDGGDNEGITLLELNDTVCKWPLAKVQDHPPYRYCGCPAFDGTSWCRKHYIASLDPNRRHPRTRIPEGAE